MKTTLLFAVAALALAATEAQAADVPAMSGTNGWDGFYLQAGAGYRQTTVKSEGLELSGTLDLDTDYPFDLNGSSSGDVDEGNFLGTVSGGYNFALSPSFILGVGGEYNFGSGTTDEASSSFDLITHCCGTHQFADISWQYNVKDSFAVFVTPGYALSDSQLAYLKVGYTRQTIDLESASGEGIDSKDVNGLLLGIGYKQIVSGGLYLYGEANAAFYQKADFKESIATPAGFMVDDHFDLEAQPQSHTISMTVGLGYQF